MERESKAEQKMDALCLPAEALAQAGLPAENVYCRRALRSILFLVFISAFRNWIRRLFYGCHLIPNASRHAPHERPLNTTFQKASV